jgi:hypothetical protein
MAQNHLHPRRHPLRGLLDTSVVVDHDSMGGTLDACGPVRFAVPAASRVSRAVVLTSRAAPDLLRS